MAINLSLAGDGASIAQAASLALGFNADTAANVGWCYATLARVTTQPTGSNAMFLVANATAAGIPNYAQTYNGPGSNLGGIGGTVIVDGTATSIPINTAFVIDHTTATAWRWVFVVWDPQASQGLQVFIAPINGAVRRESYGPGPTNTITPQGLTRIGNSAATPSGATTQFKGDIAAYFKMNRALTRAEMSLIANGQDLMTDLGLTGTTVKCYVKFTTNGTNTDLSGNGNDAVCSGTGITVVSDPTYATTGTVAVIAPDYKAVFSRRKNAQVRDMTLQVVYTGAPTSIDVRVRSYGTTTDIVPWTGVATGLANAPKGGVQNVTLQNVPLATLAGAPIWYQIEVRANAGTGWTETLDQAFRDKWAVGLVLLEIGQSNKARMYQVTSGATFTASDFIVIGVSGGPLGAFDGAQAKLTSLLNVAKCPIRVLMYAVGGSAMTGGTDADWSGTSVNSLLGKALRAIVNSGGDIDVVGMTQGEAEAGATTAITDAGAGWQAALDALRVRVNTAVGRNNNELPWIQGILNASTLGDLSSLNYPIMREAIKQWGLTRTNAHLVGLHDTATTDTIHHTALDAVHVGMREAQQTLYALGLSSSQGRGPIMTSLTFSGNVAIVTVQHDTGGSALTLRSSVVAAPPGAIFKDSTGTLTITGFAITGPTKIQYTFNRAVTGPTLTHEYDYHRSVSQPQLLSTSVEPIRVTNGSNVCTITATAHVFSVNDALCISGYDATANVGPAPVGGLVYGGGAWQCTGVVDANTLQASITNSAATSNATGGTAPQLALRKLGDIYDNGTPGGDLRGKPLLPGIILSSATPTIDYAVSVKRVPYGSVAQLAAAGLN